MKINSNVQFNIVFAEVNMNGFGSIAAPFCACCMCCMDTGGGQGFCF
ncbi:MAG: hypothetical protein U0L58_03685 [Ruminococcus sp.]|nr:hypothetical protein [Ruminococcus sp.]